MRTKEQIEYELINKLESGSESTFWQDIRDSMIGKELIRYGVELIQQQEQIRDTYSKSINLDYADYSQLAQTANALLSFVSSNRPATIVATVEAGVYPKYSLAIAPSGGKIYYYNIEPISIPTGETRQVTLYQGVLKKASSMSAFDSLEGESQNVTYSEVYYGDSHKRRRLNLGTIIPQSLSVYVYDDFVQEITPVTYLSIGNYGYVPYNFQDGSTGIILDTIYSKFYASGNISAQWLSPTSYTVSQSSFDSFVEKHDEIKSVDVIEEASFNDLPYAKSMVNKSLASYQSVTENNVEDYLKNDSRIDGILLDETTTPTTIYVKPSEDYVSYDFSDLSSELKLHSAIGTSFDVEKAKRIPVKYMFYLLSGTAVSKYDVSSVFSQYLSSETLGYCRQMPINEFTKGVSSTGLASYYSFFGLTFSEPTNDYVLWGNEISVSETVARLQPFNLTSPVFFITDEGQILRTSFKTSSDGTVHIYSVISVNGLSFSIRYNSSQTKSLGVKVVIPNEVSGTFYVPCYFTDDLKDYYIHVDQVSI